MLSKSYIIIIYVILSFFGSLFLSADYLITYWTYNLVFYASIVLLSISSRGEVKNLYYGAFILLSLIMAFRNHMGIDDSQYEYHFDRACTLGLLEYLTSANMEKGYLLFQFVLCKLFVSSFFQYQVLLSFLTFCLWGLMLKKMSVYSEPIICFFFLWTNWYFLIMYAGLIRIFFALPIALLALYYFLTDDMKRYFMLLFIAALIHSSALFLLVVLLFKYSAKSYDYWKEISFITILMMPLFFILIVKIIVPLLGSRHAGLQIASLSFSIEAFEYLPILCMGGYCRNFIVDEGEKKFYTIGLFLIACSIGLAFSSPMVPELGRIVYYTNFGIPLIASIIFNNQVYNKTNTVVLLLLLIFGFVYLMHTAFLNQSAIPHLFPYRSFL